MISTIYGKFLFFLFLSGQNLNVNNRDAVSQNSIFILVLKILVLACLCLGVNYCISTTKRRSILVVEVFAMFKSSATLLLLSLMLILSTPWEI